MHIFCMGVCVCHTNFHGSNRLLTFSGTPSSDNTFFVKSIPFFWRLWAYYCTLLVVAAYEDYFFYQHLQLIEVGTSKTL